MEIKKRRMAREGWSRLIQRRSAYKAYDLSGFHGLAGLICMDKVTSPGIKTIPGAQVRIIDNGYRWIQAAPKDAHWWLTMMVDARGQIIQFYFDITKQNVLCAEQSYFLDLFLDIVVLSDGRIILLDRDELDMALNEGVISDDDHRLAIQTADTLMREIPVHMKELEAFSYRLLSELSELV